MFNFIESAVNQLLQATLVDEQGNIDWSKWYPIGPNTVQFAIQGIAAVVYLILVSLVGMYLYNQGIHPLAPAVFQPIGSGNYAQLSNPFAQLFLSLLAFVTFF